MIEEIVLNHLTSATSSSVYMEVPATGAPSEYILIEKTGSENENLIMTSTIAIQSISTSMLKAAQLNAVVIEAMKSLISNNSVSKCKLDSDYNFSDLETKKYRYQAVFDITHY